MVVEQHPITIALLNICFMGTLYVERERVNVQETTWKDSHDTNVPITLLFITRSIGHHARWPACTKVPNSKPMCRLQCELFFIYLFLLLFFFFFSTTRFLSPLQTSSTFISPILFFFLLLIFSNRASFTFLAIGHSTYRK